MINEDMPHEVDKKKYKKDQMAKDCTLDQNKKAQI